MRRNSPSRTSRSWARTFIIATGAVLILAPMSVARAQRKADSATPVQDKKDAASLAKAAQNPVANMVSLPLQWNYSTGGGLDSSTSLVLNVQPVLPLSIGDNWLIVSRTIVPFVSIPLPTGGQSGGIADIQEQAYFTKSKPGKITWALGPILSFPTATNRLARTGQWGAGPGAVVLTMPGPWVIGLLANNVWRIGGEAHGDVLNTLTMQPFINFNLPREWSITTAPLITSNWSAANDQRWTVPIGIGVGKITRIADQPLNLGLQYYHDVNHPRFAGSEELRMAVAALWPTAAAEKEKAANAVAAKNKRAKKDD